MHDKRLGTKSYLQRITEALERWAEIDIEPNPRLAESGYWERIAIALEKMFGDGESSVAVVGKAIVGKDVVAPQGE